MAKLWRKLLCFIGHHEWTSAYDEGIKPTPTQQENMAGFADYAKIYCRHCGKVSAISQSYIDQYRP